MKTTKIARSTYQAALGHYKKGNEEKAHTLCQQVLQLVPDDTAALSLLGKVDLKAGRPEPAVKWLERVVQLTPHSSVDLCNLGVGYHRLQSLDRAAEMLARAVKSDPQNADAIWNLGLVRLDSGDPQRGLLFLARAADLRPDTWGFQQTLAKELLRVGQFNEAIQQFQRALLIDPSCVELRPLLLSALEKSERLEEAEELARQLLNENARLPERHIALGRILLKRRKLSQALAAFDQALVLDPMNTAVATPLAATFARLGRVDKVLAQLERALSIDPNLAVEHSTLVFQAAFSERYDSQRQLTAARRWSDCQATPLIAKRQPHPHERSPERRLRVGYVSPDFRGHVQRLFTLPVLRQHNHETHQIVCYSSVRKPDSYTTAIKALADEWHDVASLNDGELAQKIRDDRIDVLVDLTMHMEGCRLKVFAEKPAPVQISWLAYPGTTGVDGIDYRITDPFLDPPGAPLPYSEQSLWLPETFWCFGPESWEGAVNDLPMDRNGYVTFGSLNNFMKVNRTVLDLWARVLCANPTSKLLMMAPQDWAQDFVRRSLQNRGVAAERLDFVDMQSRDGYLQTYNRIDIALDTFPYPGHTTSLDAYWMGVPVVTLVGDTIVGRAGLSFANNLNLTDWVARDHEQFVQIATRFAGDPPHLGGLRRGLRQRLQNSPLMDAPRFTRALEGAYREAWRRWCAG